MKRIVFFVALVLVCAGAPLAYAASSIGFIQGNIWYSKEPFFAGDTVRVYSAVFNSSAQDMVGTVEFFDNGAPIGTTDFSAPSGHLRELWVDWKAAVGVHKISAKITKAFITVAGQPNKPVTISDADSGSSERTVEEPPPPPQPPAPAPAISAGASNSDFTAQATQVATTVVGQSKNFLDTLAKDWDTSLAATQKSLEKEVVALTAKENALTPTPQAQLLNDAAVGGSSSSPVFASKPTGTIGDTVNRLSKELLLLLVKGARWILETPIALYATAIIIVLYVLRVIWRIMRRRQFERAG